MPSKVAWPEPRPGPGSTVAVQLQYSCSTMHCSCSWRLVASAAPTTDALLHINASFGAANVPQSYDVCCTRMSCFGGARSRLPISCTL
jgi:hypothetical protein